MCLKKILFGLKSQGHSDIWWVHSSASCKLRNQTQRAAQVVDKKVSKFDEEPIMTFSDSKFNVQDLGLDSECKDLRPTCDFQNNDLVPPLQLYNVSTKQFGTCKCTLLFRITLTCSIPILIPVLLPSPVKLSACSSQSR